MIAFTVLDAFGCLDEIGLCCLRYRRRDYTDFPTTARLEKAVIEKPPGWKCDIRGIKNYEDLPEILRKYIEFIEEDRLPDHYGFNGPGRNDIIYRNK